jgi:hypothetical protein
MTDPNGYTPPDAFGLLRSYSRHRDFVRLALTKVIHALERRAIEHDASKMSDDEFAGFARINAAARIDKFGSPGYKEAMEREQGIVNLHFSRNSHHPEYGYPRTFLDVVEMVCDWWGARKGYDDPRSWMETVQLNLDTKSAHLTPQQMWLASEVAAFLEATP